MIREIDETTWRKFGSVCGVFCGLCRVFKKGKCGGCFELCEKSKDPCPMYLCVKKKGILSCFVCEDYPCGVLYEKGPYNPSFLDYFKKQ